MTTAERKRSHFRELLSVVFELGKPRDSQEVAEIVAKAGLFLTDAVASAVVLRRGDGAVVVAQAGQFPPPLTGSDWMTRAEVKDIGEGPKEVSELVPVPGELGATATAAPAQVSVQRLTWQEKRIGSIFVVRADRAFHRQVRLLLSLLAQQAGLAFGAAQAKTEAMLDRNKLQTVLDHMMDGLILVERQHISYVTPRASEMVGPYTPKVGDSLSDFLDTLSQHSEEKLSIRERMVEALSSPQGRPIVEFRLGSPLRRELRLQLFAIPTPTKESLLGLLMTDITREKESERLRTEFLRNVSHELRTPLSSVRAYAETLLALPEKSDPEASEEFLRTIVDQSDRLARLIGNLLTYSRAEAGAFSLHPERLDLASEIGLAVRVIEPQAKVSRVRLEVVTPEDPLRLRTDREALQQVLLNLLSNAVKYNKPGGSVHVHARAVEGMAEIEVSDTGIGLSDEDRPHVFERFFRAPTVRAHISGTGIGLSLVRSLVETMGGKITVDSRPGAGATFRVMLPRERG